MLAASDVAQFTFGDRRRFLSTKNPIYEILTCIHQIKGPARDLERILKTPIRPINFFENYQCLAAQRHLNAHYDDLPIKLK